MSAHNEINCNGSSISSTIDRMIGSSTSAQNESSVISPSDQAEFIPTPTWKGIKQGYYFGTSENGTGYYLDVNAPGAAASTRKRPRSDMSPNGNEIQAETNSIAETKKKSGKQLLEEAEATLASLSHKPKTLDLSNSLQSIKSSSLALERAISKNQLQRAKFSTQPEKFMESELALHEEISALKGVAATEDLTCFQTLVDLGTVESLVTLLSHENVDVACAVINLFVELLDPALLVQEDSSVSEDQMKGLGLLTASFVYGEPGAGNGLEAAISNLGRLHDGEEEEEQGMDDVLTLVENLMDLDRYGVLKLVSSTSNGNSKGDDNGDSTQTTTYQSIAATVAKSTALISWLLTKVSQKKSEDYSMSLKLHASEVLASLLQHDDSRIHVSHLNKLPPFKSNFEDDDSKPPPGKKSKDSLMICEGIEMLLQSIAAFRKKDPETEEECEFLENIFDGLAASLLNDTNVDSFLEGQGIELMLRCMREKVHSGGGAIKVLFFALSGTSERGTYKKACETFVEAGGLKVIFPIFMGRGGAIPKPSKCSDAGNLELIRKYTKRENNDGNDKKNKKKMSKRAKQAVSAKREWLQNMESYSIQIVYALTRFLDDGSAHDAKARLSAKFVEGDCEKCNRLAELCLKYDNKMRQAEYQYYKSDEAEEAEENGIDIDLAALNAKLKGGGDIFHRIGAIAAFAATESKRCHEHILEQLKTQNSGIGVVKAALEEFATVLDDGDQKAQLDKYIAAI